MSERRDNASKTISIVMIITLLGKVLGLVRDRLLAINYGTGMEANAFYTASRIPRVFFDAVFASAIAACFIPVFSGYLTREGKDRAMRFAGNFLTVMAAITALLTAVGMGFAGPLVELFADGYDEATAALAAELTRVMFPTVLFTGIAFSFVGILQSLDEFNIPAVISTVSNLVIIVYYVTLNDRFGIYGLAAAFLVGWLLQAVVQIPALRRKGFRYYPSLRLRSDGMKQVFALMVPVMVSTWVQPINLTINSKFGSRLYDGAGVSAIEIATNLYLIIAGVFVLSVTNVIFPKLSRQTAQGDGEAFRDTLNQTTHSTLFLVLPMSAGLMMLARPLISFVFGGGEFDAGDVDITAQALVWVSLGMAGYGVQNILSRAYFARQDGRTPLVAGAVSIGVNILLCMVLVDSMAVAGLAIASAVSSTVYALLLLLPFEVRRASRVFGAKFWLDILKMLLAAGLMAGAVWLLNGWLAGLLGPGKLSELVQLGAGAGCGVLVYFGAAFVLRVPEMGLVAGLVKRLVKRG
ncbi:MAG: murein biosynthesis integral membrane protein MurJ [Oscillospiraceae bacterium]|nr:murein biosynthesis integral membrane protein MurJ [Oscillospiraceae bacterium]